MKTTLESLLKLAKTEDGLREITEMVAKLRGWKFFTEREVEQTGHLFESPDGRHVSDRLPDYTGSLDAMAEAEDTLQWDEQVKYYSLIYKMAVGGDAALYQFEIVHTKAPKRAIAFILTKQPTQSA